MNSAQILWNGIGPIPRARASTAVSQRLLSPASKVPARFDFLSTCRRTSLSGESCTTEASPSIFVASPMTVCESSRLQKNDAGPPEIQWSRFPGQQDTTPQDIRARLAGQARARGFPNFGSRLSRMSRASRAKNYALAEFFSILLKQEVRCRTREGSITSESGQEHQARSPTQPSVLQMQTSGTLLLAARKIGQNVRTALHLGGSGIGDCQIEMIFNLEEQRQFIQRIEPQIF
jgi:hypothetical protein